MAKIGVRRLFLCARTDWAASDVCQLSAFEDFRRSVERPEWGAFQLGRGRPLFGHNVSSPPASKAAATLICASSMRFSRDIQNRLLNMTLARSCTTWTVGNRATVTQQQPCHALGF